MDKCKNNILWKLGPFKIYGEHFYLIEEVHVVIASSFDRIAPFILARECQNCSERKDIVNLTREELQELIKEFPMAFKKDTLDTLKNELSK